jgi:hypothetical protein
MRPRPRSTRSWRGRQPLPTLIRVHSRPFVVHIFPAPLRVLQCFAPFAFFAVIYPSVQTPDPRPKTRSSKPRTLNPEPFPGIRTVLLDPRQLAATLPAEKKLPRQRNPLRCNALSHHPPTPANPKPAPIPPIPRTFPCSIYGRPHTMKRYYPRLHTSHSSYVSHSPYAVPSSPIRHLTPRTPFSTISSVHSVRRLHLVHPFHLIHSRPLVNKIPPRPPLSHPSLSPSVSLTHTPPTTYKKTTPAQNELRFFSRSPTEKLRWAKRVGDYGVD